MKPVSMTEFDTAGQREALYPFMERRHRAGSLEEIYDAGLDAILSALACERASTLLLDRSGVMRFVAWRGLSDDYRKAAEGHSPWKADDPHPEPFSVPDTGATELEESRRAVLAREGIRALGFIPLLVNGRLAGGIAHDFNNILNIIQGYAFVLRRQDAQNSQIEESLAVINKTVQRGSALVQQLLTLARKSSAELEAMDANPLVEGLIALLRQTFPKTIELKSSLEAELPAIKADKNQIEQALLNLCLNSRDAIPNGGTLSVKTASLVVKNGSKIRWRTNSFIAAPLSATSTQM